MAAGEVGGDGDGTGGGGGHYRTQFCAGAARYPGTPALVTALASAVGDGDGANRSRIGGLMRGLTVLVSAWLLAGMTASVTAQNRSGWRLDPSLEAQRSTTDKLLIGISIVNESVVWVSGAGGTWARTTDGGATWRSGVVAGADSLQFRDVHAISATTAYLLSIGEGAQSRVYKTTDGGANWSLQFTNREPRAFFDCFGFWDANSGIA
ncbi:MAG: WD40/YVTN/BNR-like repeat-containing protein, partial [Longimicrobiales bacterium]